MPDTGRRPTRDRDRLLPSRLPATGDGPGNRRGRGERCQLPAAGFRQRRRGGQSPRTRRARRERTAKSACSRPRPGLHCPPDTGSPMTCRAGHLAGDSGMQTVRPAAFTTPAAPGERAAPVAGDGRACAGGKMHDGSGFHVGSPGALRESASMLSRRLLRLAGGCRPGSPSREKKTARGPLHYCSGGPTLPKAMGTTLTGRVRGWAQRHRDPPSIAVAAPRKGCAHGLSGQAVRARALNAQVPARSGPLAKRLLIFSLCRHFASLPPRREGSLPGGAWATVASIVAPNPAQIATSNALPPSGRRATADAACTPRNCRAGRCLVTHERAPSNGKGLSRCETQRPCQESPYDER